MIQDKVMGHSRDAACRITPNVGMYGFVNYVYLWTKVWEYADTVFLILKGKRLILLHVWCVEVQCHNNVHSRHYLNAIAFVLFKL